MAGQLRNQCMIVLSPVLNVLIVTVLIEFFIPLCEDISQLIVSVVQLNLGFESRLLAALYYPTVNETALRFTFYLVFFLHMLFLKFHHK